MFYSFQIESFLFVHRKAFYLLYSTNRMTMPMERTAMSKIGLHYLFIWLLLNLQFTDPKNVKKTQPAIEHVLLISDLIIFIRASKGKFYLLYSTNRMTMPMERTAMMT